MTNRNFTTELTIEGILMDKNDWMTAKQLKVRLHLLNIHLSIEEIKEYIESIVSSYQGHNKIVACSSADNSKIFMTKIK